MTKVPTKVTRGRMVILLVLSILLVDQTIKIAVKTNMTLHECIPVFSWFKILFIENNGMAYGMEIGSKLLLSILRVLLVGVISLYAYRVAAKGVRTGFIVCLSMIVAGALGNIIDGMFYGLIFEESTIVQSASLVPFGEGYAPFMMGKVVDMFYFPIIETTWPLWVPMVGGEEFIFFSPVFNFADASISVGVIWMIIFYRKEVSEVSVKNLFKMKSEEMKSEEMKSEE